MLSCTSDLTAALQQAMMAEKMESMSQEERSEFIKEQMDALQHELSKVNKLPWSQISSLIASTGLLGRWTGVTGLTLHSVITGSRGHPGCAGRRHVAAGAGRLPEGGQQVGQSRVMRV